MARASRPTDPSLIIYVPNFLVEKFDAAEIDQNLHCLKSGQYAKSLIVVWTYLVLVRGELMLHKILFEREVQNAYLTLL